MITTQLDAAKGEIHAYEEGRKVGLLNFEVEGAVMTIMHTFAYEEGKGVGKLLVVAAIRHAQSNGWKIDPVCGFARVVMERNPEYAALMVG